MRLDIRLSVRATVLERYANIGISFILTEERKGKRKGKEREKEKERQ